MKITDEVPAWESCSLIRRLQMCRVMLYQHGILTEYEKRQADKRIDRKIAAITEKLLKERINAR